MTSPSAKEYIIKGFENNLYIGGICAGPLVLDKFKLLNGYRFTCYPGVEEDMVNTNVKDHYISDESIVIDRNLITSIGPGTASDFALKLLEILTSKEEADSVHGNWWGKRDEN